MVKKFASKIAHNTAICKEENKFKGLKMCRFKPSDARHASCRARVGMFFGSTSVHSSCIQFILQSELKTVQCCAQWEALEGTSSIQEGNFGAD